MKNINNMTTEELESNMEILMRRFEQTTCKRTQNMLINTIGKIERLRDKKSWLEEV